MNNNVCRKEASNNSYVEKSEGEQNIYIHTVY